MSGTGRIVLCAGMPRAASTLQYQLALHVCTAAGPTTAAGWYDGEPLTEILERVPPGETWIFKVHRHSFSYRFEEAATTGRVFGLSTHRDLRKVIASYRTLHDKSMWWVTRHRILEDIIADHRRWSESDAVLMQSYDDLIGDPTAAAAAMCGHLDIDPDADVVADAGVRFGRDRQRARTEGRGRDDAGAARPDDLLLVDHVAAHERTVGRDLGTAWVESIAGPWLRAQGHVLTTSRLRRGIARTRHAPRWLWFLHWHLMKGSLVAAALRRARLARSWVRFGASRLRLAPFLVRRAAARFHARLPGRHVEAGATTVVLVSWNAEAIIDDTLRLVRRWSPAATRVIVVDNGSVDRTCALAHRHPGVEVLPLHRNVGHGLAMDLGFLAARTEFCVSLDVDAFPIRPDWLDQLRRPLDNGATVSGALWTRDVGFYIHPCCLMMRRDRFVARRHSFETRFLPGINPQGQMGMRYWDTGERIAMREGPDKLAPFPMTSTTRFMVGMVFGDFVYHNGSTTRAADADDWADDDGLEGAVQVWREAIERYDAEIAGPVQSTSYALGP